MFSTPVLWCRPPSQNLPSMCECEKIFSSLWLAGNHLLECDVMRFCHFASAENGIIKSDKVYEVMLATDRAHFSRCNPYMDSPQSIGKSSGTQQPTEILINDLTILTKSISFNRKASKQPSAPHIWYEFTQSAVPALCQSDKCGCIDNTITCPAITLKGNVDICLKFRFLFYTY